MNAETPRDRMIRTTGYVARCVVAGALALVCARALGLEHPVWASVSALVVSQEQLGDTRRSLGGRAIGTLIGVSTGLLAGLIATHLPDPQVAGVVMATAFCAVVARERPRWRTCLWTGPIVLLTASAAETLVMAAFHRAVEVLLGGLIGAVAHETASLVIASIVSRKGRQRIFRTH